MSNFKEDLCLHCENCKELVHIEQCIESVVTERLYIFYHDGEALAHTCHIVKNWFFDDVYVLWPTEFWPHNRFQLNTF